MQQSAHAIAEATNFDFIHPECARLLHKIPHATVASFSVDQLRHIALATAPEPTPHLIDLRTSVSWLRKGFYVRLLVGRERRNAARLRREGYHSLVSLLMFFGISIWCVVSMALIAALVGAYFIKSIVGIDVFPGPSFMHDFFWSSSQTGAAHV